MNLKPAYEYLNRPHRIDLKIQRLTYKREALMSCLLPKALTPKVVQVQEQTPGDKLADVIGDVELIDREIEDLCSQKAMAIRETLATIDKIKREEERVVLYGFFIARRSMSEIAGDLHYSVRAAYYIRRSALEHLLSMI